MVREMSDNNTNSSSSPGQDDAERKSTDKGHAAADGERKPTDEADAEAEDPSRASLMPGEVPETSILPPDDEEEGELGGEYEDIEGVSGEGAPPSTDRSNLKSMSGGGEEDEDDPMAKKRKDYEQRRLKRKEKEDRDTAEALLDAEQPDDEDEDENWLLYRHDSELTPKQIVEKDIAWYDLLLSNEELMDMPKPQATVEVEEVEVEVEEEEEEEEEIVEEVVEESEEEEEVKEEEEEDFQPEVVDQDDPDNIVNMMMQQQGEDEDDLKILFQTEGFGDQQDTDSLANQEGIIGINLSEDTKHFLEIEPELTEWREKTTWLSTKKILLHIYIYEEKSEFHPHYKIIKSYPDFAMLLGIDFLQQTGNPLYLCVTPEARNYILNPPKKRKVYVDLKKKEEEAWDKLASIYPRKWRSLGSELEVEQENIKNTRPLITVYAYRYSEYFLADTQFEDSKYPPGCECNYTEFESKPLEEFAGIERKEISKGVQVNPPKVDTEAQTGFSFKRNKMVQHETQYVNPEVAETAMAAPEFTAFISKVRPPIERALQQNEMLNIMADDYHNLKAVKGHEVEFNNESVLLQEYQTYADLRHSKGRCVSYMTFHPLLDEVVIMAFTEDVTADRKIDFHSKTLMDPNFVLIWDLKDPSKPQLMLDAPSDVYSFMVSPSDANLICGGCENGQIVLWDLGKFYIELRNRIQDRKHKQEATGNNHAFLDKLKDSAEKYVCPLIPTSGMSNLDSSHKRAVTCVHWLPPHVELAKNGNLYDNSWGGRCAQFMSVAGDSTVRVWDIRIQKLGLDEFDSEPVLALKINPWHHLENNMWKFSMKYTLDDGSGTMFCSIITLSEGKIGDILEVDATSHHGSYAESSGEGIGGSGSGKSTSTTSASIARSRSYNKERKKTGTGEDTSRSNMESASTANAGSADKAGGDPGKTSASSEPKQSVQPGGGSISSGGAHSVISRSVAGTVEDMENISAIAKRGGMLSATNAHTSFFAGTETGHVALVDWLRNKDGSINPDAAGNKVCQNMYIENTHDGSITSIHRSPFHQDLILVVGGGTISIWKENSGHPILATLGGENFPWCGCWSNTRPGVFFCGTREGALQVWDLMEKSHAPVLTQQISPGRIVTCATPKALTQKKHFLAMGDSQGNLFVMLIPRYYTRLQPQENQTMIELMTREENRMASWITDAENREERIKIINDGFKNKRIQKTEKDIHEQNLKVEARLALEYGDFLEYQAKIASKLKREEPELPTDELDIDAELEALVNAAETREEERIKNLLENAQSYIEGSEEQAED